MPTDAVTRLLLAGILACLIVLIVQGFGSDDPPGAGAPLEGGGVGRYRVFSTRAGTPVLIRTDTATGRVWRQELRGGRDRWIELIEPGDSRSGVGAPDAAPDEPAPEPSPVARAPRATPEPPVAPAPAATAGMPPEPTTPGSAGAGHDLDTYLEAVRKPELPHDIRTWAVAQLGRSDDPRSTEALVAALGDADPRVVAAAVTAVASRRDDARVAEALAELTSHEDPGVQAALAALDRR